MRASTATLTNIQAYVHAYWCTLTQAYLVTLGYGSQRAILFAFFWVPTNPARLHCALFISSQTIWLLFALRNTIFPYLFRNIPLFVLNIPLFVSNIPLLLLLFLSPLRSHICDHICTGTATTFVRAIYFSHHSHYLFSLHPTHICLPSIICAAYFVASH